MKALLGLPKPSLHTAGLYKWQPVSCLDLTLLPGEQAPPPPRAVPWAISQALFSVSDSLFSCSLKALVVHSSLSSLQILFIVFSCGVCPPFFPISLSFTSPSLIGGNANPEK